MFVGQWKSNLKGNNRTSLLLGEKRERGRRKKKGYNQNYISTASLDVVKIIMVLAGCLL